MKTFDVLKERGYIYQATDEVNIKKLLNEEKITFYLGIDPTADSLHIGHFFALTMVRRMQEFGHRAIIIIGGATALVGDPSGKTQMRNMLTKEEVDFNKKEVKNLVKRFVYTEGDNAAIILDNADWINKETYIDFLRKVGIHFNVNKMLATECYKKRLEEGGLTFLEMGYMLMQAYDFVYLNREYDCKLQVGGSDQWANIVAGVDLGRKLDNLDGRKVDRLFGLTCPLLVKADGEKMGKTASGTMWVSREKTTVYDFYQVFINAFDEDVERLLAFFTDLEMDYIKDLCQKDIIKAKKIMAYEITKLVHGEDEANKVAEASTKIFTEGVSDDMPFVEIKQEQLDNLDIMTFVVLVGLVPSKSEAKRLIEQGGLKLNQEKIADVNKMIKQTDFKDNILVLQKGKKVYLKVVLKG